jgi:hypothetical protein
VTQALDRVRQTARQRRKEKFTALFHHLSIDLFWEAFLALKRDAAPGVDDLTWRTYAADLEGNLIDLHARVQDRPKGDRRGSELNLRGGVPRVQLRDSGPSVDSTMRWTRWWSGSPGSA